MIKEFLEYQQNVRGLSPLTIQEYEKNLSYFVQFASLHRWRWSTITKDDIDLWTASMTSTGTMPRTIQQRISTLRTFYGWLCNTKGLSVNPARYCQTPKADDELPKAVSLEKVDAYLSQPARTEDDRLTHLVTAIIVETGLRLGEVLQLRKSDFRNAGIVVKGKGRRERLVYYSHRTIEAIRAYAGAGDELFYGVSQERARYAMYHTLGRLIERVSPHKLRHTFATHMLEAGMPLEVVSELLGHKHVTTTQIYARATAQMMGEQYHKFIN